MLRKTSWKDHELDIIAGLYPRPFEVKEFLRNQNEFGMLQGLDKSEIIDFLTATGFRKKLYG